MAEASGYNVETQSKIIDISSLMVQRLNAGYNVDSVQINLILANRF